MKMMKKKGNTGIRKSDDLKATDFRVASVVISLFSWGLLQFGDLFHSKKITTAALALLGIVWSAVLTHLSGLRKYPQYFRVWQPLHGGFSFVLLQASGWTLFGATLAMMWLLLANFDATIKIAEGNLPIVGCIGFLAQALLNASIDHFKATSKQKLARRRSKRNIATRDLLSNPYAIGSIIINIVTIILFIATDYFRKSSGIAETLQAMGMVTIIIGCFTTHLFVGKSMHGSKFSFYMPFSGGTRFVLLQIFGWFTGAVAFNIWITVLDSQYEIVSGVFQLIGALGSISQLLLLLSVPQFVETSSTIASTWNRHSKLALITILISGITTVAFYFTYDKLKAADVNIRWIAILLLSLILITGPFSHISAKITIVSFPWLPIHGSRAFIIFQSFGWMLWLVGLSMCSSLYFVLPIHTFILSIGPVCFAGSLLLVLSIPQYSLERSVLQHPNKMKETSSSVGSSLLCFMIGFGALILSIFADVWRSLRSMNDTKNIYIVSSCLYLSIILNLVSQSMTIYIGMIRYKTFQIFQAFQGGTSFIIIQAIAWTISAVAILAHIFFINSVQSRSLDANFYACSLFGSISFLCSMTLLSSLDYFRDSAGGSGKPFALKLSWNDLYSASCGSTDDDEIKMLTLNLAKIDTLIHANADAKKMSIQEPEHELLRFGLSELRKSFQDRLLDIKSSKDSLYLCFDRITIQRKDRPLIFSGSRICMILSFLCFFSCDHTSNTEFVKPLFISGCVISILGCYITHAYVGKIMHGSSYRFFQPFVGGIRFVSMQVCAFVLFGIALIVSMTALMALDLVNLRTNFIGLVIGIIWLSAQILLRFALNSFNPNLANKSKRNFLLSNYSRQIFTVMISLSGCTLFFAADQATHWLTAPWVFSIILCGWVAILISAPMTLAINIIYDSKDLSFLHVLAWAVWSFASLFGIIHIYETFDQHIESDSLNGFEDLVRDSGNSIWFVSAAALGMLSQCLAVLSPFSDIDQDLFDGDEKIDVDAYIKTVFKDAKFHDSKFLLSNFMSRYHRYHLVMVVLAIIIALSGFGRILSISLMLIGIGFILLTTVPVDNLKFLLHTCFLCFFCLPLYFAFMTTVSALLLIALLIYGVNIILSFVSPQSCGYLCDKSRSAVHNLRQYWLIGVLANMQYVHLVIFWCIFYSFPNVTLGLSIVALARFVVCGPWIACLGYCSILTTSKGQFGTQHYAVLFVILFIFPLFELQASYGTPTLPASVISWIMHFFYVLTFRSSPHLSGVRKWKAFIDFVWLWDIIENYYQPKIVVDDHVQHPFDSSSTLYLAGWHPHGVLPISATWIPMSRSWKQNEKLHRLELNLCSSTINHLVPQMRDMIQWTGGLEVSRKSMNRALGAGISLALVPGGQSESIEASSTSMVYSLVARHKGFVKLALRHGASLLPIFTFGENKLMDNIDMKPLQRWTKSFTGFPFPFIPYGLYDVLPIPRREKIYCVVGKPIHLPKLEEADINQTVVNKFHRMYYDEIKRIFNRHKAAAGRAGYNLCLI